MSSALQLSRLFRDLQQLAGNFQKIEADPSAQGALILDAFLRVPPYQSGAVFLRESRESPAMKLVGQSGLLSVPSHIETNLFEDVVDIDSDGARFGCLPIWTELDPRPHTLVPLRYSRDSFGLVALGRTEEVPAGDDHLDTLRAMSSYLAALMHGQRMTREVREGEFQLKYRLWELESLYDIGLSIASTLDLDKLAEEILVRTISLLNARRAALFLRKGERFVLHSSFGDVRSQFLDDELPQDDAAKLFVQARPIVFDNNADCIFPSCDSFVALPIRSGDEVIGVLAAADRELREGGVGPFEPNDLRMLSLFANQVSIALENARLHHEALEKQSMERELELAATIQRDILPRSLPALPAFDIAAFSRSARQLGGDYHAFFESEGVLTLCVADVSGKSVPAAVLVSALHAALQLLVDEGRPLGEIATELNRHIHRWSSENKFITLILASFDPEAQLLHFVNAGHNPAYILSGGNLEELQSHGLPIGILAGTIYRTQMRRFPTGSLFVAYSDGFTEAENLAEEEFGNERLEEILRARGNADCSSIRDAIAEAADSFAAGAPQKDDQTLVIVRALSEG
ncbi:MAG TPA: GAF domain-containing SpoIIE family protein phosphatase [Thermoanaerobaculia bacterium]|nr:GAF domain-containing SpoIIE family protein phosphatase [Thermoanaerobaculia bacterium]